jgi:hypothetical protein
MGDDVKLKLLSPNPGKELDEVHYPRGVTFERL